MFFIFGKSHIIFSSQDGEDIFVYSTSTLEKTLKWSELLAVLPEKERDAGAQPQPTDKDPVQLTVGCSSDNLYAICDNKKNMLILDRHFTVKKRFQLKRNCTKVEFSSNENSVFVCDKTGDFYEFKIDAEGFDGECLLGHCSMLLDFEVTQDMKYLITADRDEKIRVTNYPNAFDILAYCMGHQEFVSCVRVLDGERLISSSGDGRLIIWNFKTGEMISEFSFGQDNTPKVIESKSAKFAIKSIAIDNRKNPEFIAITFFRRAEVVIFRLTADSRLEKILEKPTEQVPIFVEFDRSHINYLWLVGATAHKNVEVFELVSCELRPPFQCSGNVELLATDAQLSALIDEERKDDRLELLMKHSYNNVGEYHERKRQRIEREKHGSVNTAKEL